jgi:hypothetical protein
MIDHLSPQARTWSQDDKRVPATVPGWLQPLLLEVAAAKAELAVQLDRRLETARSAGRV